MSWFIATILSPILVIGLLVVVHEFGHFIVAKWCGIGVLKFSVGFGPALFRFTRGETVYQLSAIPLGGFVRMLGDVPDFITGAQPTDELVREEAREANRKANREEPAPEPEVSPELAAILHDRSRWFVEKTLWQRAAVVFAGPLFNFVLACLLVFVAALLYGEEVPIEAPRIGKIWKGSPAAEAGLLTGDEVKLLNGQPVDSWRTLASTIRDGSGTPVQLTVRREGEDKERVFSIIPQAKSITEPTGEKKRAHFLGIGQATRHQDSSFGRALKVGVLWTVDKSVLTYMGLWGMLSGHVSTDDLAGPLFILDTAGKQAQKGFENLLYFTALLSVSLAVLNLLPIPVLDGGHLLFFLLEGIFGPISIRKKEFAQQVGMVLLLFLMVFAIRNDIVRDPAKNKGELEWTEEKKPADPSAANPPQPAPEK